MRRWRVYPTLHKVEEGNPHCVGWRMNMLTNAYDGHPSGTPRVYLDAKDELDAWIKAKKYVKEQTNA